MFYKETYTADDEEPKCGRCEHFADGFDCVNSCGAKHAWCGYKRAELVEIKESED